MYCMYEMKIKVTFLVSYLCFFNLERSLTRLIVSLFEALMDVGQGRTSSLATNFIPENLDISGGHHVPWDDRLHPLEVPGVPGAPAAPVPGVPGPHSSSFFTPPFPDFSTAQRIVSDL